MALARFAGNYNALDYAYGIAGGSGAAPLQVISGSNSSGTYTLTCSPATLYTSSGIAIPISTATPINVGSDSNQDLSVTPTSVSQNGLNQLLITGAFTYAHSTGANVSSGTFGLAEASLAASKAGGGTVTVDAAWFRAGGTQAIFNGQTAYAGVTLVNSVAGAVNTAQVTLTLAQIQAAFTTPIQIVPAPGVGFYVDVIDASFDYVYGSAAYTGGGAIQLSYGAGVGTPATGTIAAATLTGLAANNLTKLLGIALGPGASSTWVNKAINYTNATANFAAGTGGSATISANYKIIAAS